MNKEEFIKELGNINIMLSSSQLDQLDKYYHLLKEWNEKINLTRIIEEEDGYTSLDDPKCVKPVGQALEEILDGKTKVTFKKLTNI